jgi:hypothetical protein
MRKATTWKLKQAQGGIKQKKMSRRERMGGGVIGTLGYVGEERKDDLEHLDTQTITSSYRETHGQTLAEDWRR